MEFLPCFIVLIVIVATAAIVISAVRNSQTNDCYSRLAQHYVGTRQPGGMFSHPKVCFVHGGAPVIVDVYSTGGEDPSYFTRIQFALPPTTPPLVRCEVYPEGMWARFGKLFGMDDVEIGSAAFDEAYVIKAVDSPKLRELLNPAVQDLIEQLRRFLGNHDIYVSFESRRLLIRKRSFIREFDLLVRYTELAIQLYELAVAFSDEGIEFVEADTPPNWSGAVCQICGEEISDDVVFCRRCKTPHHLDCWKYYGACSTYGCQEKKYLRPDSRRARREKKRL